MFVYVLVFVLLFFIPFALVFFIAFLFSLSLSILHQNEIISTTLFVKSFIFLHFTIQHTQFNVVVWLFCCDSCWYFQAFTQNTWYYKSYVLHCYFWCCYAICCLLSVDNVQRVYALSIVTNSMWINRYDVWMARYLDVWYDIVYSLLWYGWH